MEKMTDRKSTITGPMKQDVMFGLAIALFFLWLPLLFPEALSGLDAGSSLRGTRGLLETLAIIGGFSLMLLLDRFAARASLGLRRLWSCIALMVLTLALHFLAWPVTAGILAMFVGAGLVAMQVLPLLHMLRGGERTARVFSMAIGFGCVLAIAGHMFLDMARARMTHVYPLVVVLTAGLLCTGGLYVSQRLQNMAVEEETTHAWVQPPGRAMLIACCCGTLLSGMGALFLALRIYTERMSGVDDIHTPTLVMIVVTVAGLTFIVRRHKLALGYIALVGSVLGGLMLLSGLYGQYIDYFMLFCLLTSSVSLFALLLRYVYQLVAPVNRIFVNGLGCALLFSQSWLLANPEHLSAVGHFFQSNLAVTALLGCTFFLCLIVMKPLHGQPAPSPHPEDKAVEEAVAAAPDAAKVPVAREEPEQVDNLYGQLTATEKKVYELILAGYSNQQMADLLFVSINTIKFHIKNILAKAGATKKSQLMSRHIFASPNGEAVGSFN